MRVAIICILLALPSVAPAARADCGAVNAAFSVQAKTPFHAMITRAGASPAGEAIWIHNTVYTKMGGNWFPSPGTPGQAPSVIGGIPNFSACRRLGDDAIRGEATVVYAAKMESGEDVQLWVSTKSGLPLRELVDVKSIKVTADFDYENVRQPPVQ